MTSEILSEIYRNKGFSSNINLLYSDARKRDPSITRKDIKKFLQGELSWQLSFRPRKKFISRQVVSFKPLQNFCSDIAFFDRLSKHNKNYKYICVVADIFSRHLWAIPIKNKSAKVVTEVFRQLFVEELKLKTPFTIFCDRGTEYVNASMKQFLKEINGKVYHVTTDLASKSSICERLIRSLKAILFTWMQETFSNDWLSILPRSVSFYNNRPHRSNMNLSPRYVLSNKKVWNSIIAFRYE
jgi:transposase InsO family protein